VFVPSQLPSPLGDALADVRGLPTDQAPTLPPAERAAWLIGLRQLVDAAESAFCEVLASFDANGDGETLHAARSTTAWLRGAAHLAPGDAAERVRIARGLRDGSLASPVQAMADGEVTFDQTRAVAKAVAKLPRHQVTEAVTTLTDLARRADAGRVRTAGRYLRFVADPDGAQLAVEADYTRRFLNLSPLLDGMVAVDGVLDAEGAATVSAALQPFGVPCSPDDERNAAQRRADGFVELARLALDHEQLPISGGGRPHLEVLCPVDTLLGDAGVRPALLPQAPGGPGLVPHESARRLSCDATVARVLLNAESVPIDLGRSQRLFPPALRRALALRDGGCRFPGCGFPSAWTDAHHLDSWAQGGLTSRSNGLLLCRFHHRKVHEGGWCIRAVGPKLGADGELSFLGPDGQRLSGRPPPPI